MTGKSVFFIVLFAALFSGCTQKDKPYYFYGFPYNGLPYANTTSAKNFDEPVDFQGYLDRAVAYIKAGEYQRAIADATYVLEHDSYYDTWSYGTRLLASINAGRYEQAFADLNLLGIRYYSGEPRDAWLNYMSGIISDLMGDAEAAKEKINFAIILDPDYKKIKDDYKKYFKASLRKAKKINNE